MISLRITVLQCSASDLCHCNNPSDILLRLSIAGFASCQHPQRRLHSLKLPLALGAVAGEPGLSLFHVRYLHPLRTSVKPYSASNPGRTAQFPR